MIKNIRKIVPWLFAIMIISFSISIILFRSAGVNLKDFEDTDYNYSSFDEAKQIKGKFKEDINDRRNFNIQDINTLDINTIRADIRFIPEARDDIEVHYHGSIASNKAFVLPELTTEVKNKTLQVKINHKNFNFTGFYSSSVDLDIYIPSKYSESIAVATTSGDINLGNLDIKNINVESVSGDIYAESLYTEKSYFKSISGEIELKDFKGEIGAKTTSGELYINFKSLENNVNIDSISGEIEIDLPNDAEFYLESKSTSGEIECDFPISIEGKFSDKNKNGRVGQKNNRISISTVSGDIEISKK